MWEHCPTTAHQFAVFAQHLDERSCAGLAPELKWRSILVRCIYPESPQGLPHDILMRSD